MAERRTFAELKAPRGETACRRCGVHGTHRVSVVAVTAVKSGNGQTLARRSWRLCESCAVTVYERLAGALDAKPRQEPG